METKIKITAPMHVSAAGFASGVATALKALRSVKDTGTVADIEREIELLLSKANHNLNFNNAIIAHREGFDPQNVRLRCRIDKDENVLYLHIRGPNNESGETR